MQKKNVTQTRLPSSLLFLFRSLPVDASVGLVFLSLPPSHEEIFPLSSPFTRARRLDEPATFVL